MTYYVSSATLNSIHSRSLTRVHANSCGSVHKLGSSVVFNAPLQKQIVCDDEIVHKCGNWLVAQRQMRRNWQLGNKQELQTNAGLTDAYLALITLGYSVSF